MKSKPAMGFLNPWLYQLKSGLTDITKGTLEISLTEEISEVEIRAKFPAVMPVTSF